MKKTVFFLALIMLLTSFVACSNDKPPVKGNEDSNEQESVYIDDDGNQYDSDGYLLDDVGRIDFQQKVIKILAWEECYYNEFGMEFEDCAGTIDQAVYRRNDRVQDRLNISLEYIYSTGTDATQTEFVTKASNLAGENDVQIIAGYSQTASTMMIHGITADLNTLDYVDFTKPWWKSDMVDKCSIWGRLYFCSGDIAPSLMGQSYMIFYNKKIATNFQFPDLYEMVRQKQWTLEQMFTLGAQVAQDLGTENEKDASDFFGFSCYAVRTDAFFQGSGLFTLENADDGSILVSDDFSSQKVQSLLEKIVGYATANENCFSNYNDTVYIDSWNSGNVAFLLEIATQAPLFVAEDLQFGVLPMPMYDAEQQKEYYSVSGFAYTMYSVPRMSASDPAVGATLECLASEGYRTTTPALFENLFRLRSSESPEDYEMWGLISDSIILDAGRVHSEYFNDYTWSLFRGSVINRSSDWMSKYAMNASSLVGKALTLSKTMESIESAFSG